MIALLYRYLTRTDKVARSVMARFHTGIHLGSTSTTTPRWNHLCRPLLPPFLPRTYFLLAAHYVSPPTGYRHSSPTAAPPPPPPIAPPLRLHAPFVPWPLIPTVAPSRSPPVARLHRRRGCSRHCCPIPRATARYSPPLLVVRSPFVVPSVLLFRRRPSCCPSGPP